MPMITTAMTAKPPTTPPTIAPVLLLYYEEVRVSNRHNVATTYLECEPEFEVKDVVAAAGIDDVAEAVDIDALVGVETMVSLIATESKNIPLRLLFQLKRVKVTVCRPDASD